MSRYWTVEEHERFLEARRIYGRKDTKSIAEYVGTRTVTQVRTHTQKYERRLELARRTGGPGFRVRSKRNSEQRGWKNKYPNKITIRMEQDSSVSSTSSNVSVTRNSIEFARCHMDTQSPYSVQQTYMYSERNPSDADPFELVDSDLYSDYLSFPNQSGEAANNNAATDTSTRPWDDSGKNICPYSASVHELYSNLPFWQNVIAKSSWRLHRAKTPWEGLGFEREGFVESSNDVDNNDGLCKDENVLDVDNIESTEDLETALMEYFQRKPGFTSLNEADTFPLLQSSSSPSSFRM